MTSIVDLNKLVFFAKVVDAGSYSAAAEALDMLFNEREIHVRNLTQISAKANAALHQLLTFLETLP